MNSHSFASCFSVHSTTCRQPPEENTQYWEHDQATNLQLHMEYSHLRHRLSGWPFSSATVAAGEAQGISSLEIGCLSIAVAGMHTQETDVPSMSCGLFGSHRQLVGYCTEATLDEIGLWLTLRVRPRLLAPFVNPGSKEHMINTTFIKEIALRHRAVQQASPMSFCYLR